MWRGVEPLKVERGASAATLLSLHVGPAHQQLPERRQLIGQDGQKKLDYPSSSSSSSSSSSLQPGRQVERRVAVAVRQSRKAPFLPPRQGSILFPYQGGGALGGEYLVEVVSHVEHLLSGQSGDHLRQTLQRLLLAVEDCQLPLRRQQVGRVAGHRIPKQSLEPAAGRLQREASWPGSGSQRDPRPRVIVWVAVVCHVARFFLFLVFEASSSSSSSSSQTS
ncbi:hypothetical protein EYF80_051188 [Liparis tanakae]|uniref:Uncharacterized protein n=1 Tax=Liparis tanakae TaxID=230148 RepID=A0A4Z2FCK6_9TELE|nr:hypothetical protein EYF80_051188 [Liparis tanakae]